MTRQVIELGEEKRKGQFGLPLFKKLVAVAEGKLSFEEILAYVDFKPQKSSEVEIRDRLTRNASAARKIYGLFADDTQVLKVQHFMNVGTSMKSRSNVVAAWIQNDLMTLTSGAQTQRVSRQPSRTDREELRRRRT